MRFFFAFVRASSKAEESKSANFPYKGDVLVKDRLYSVTALCFDTTALTFIGRLNVWLGSGFPLVSDSSLIDFFPAQF